MKRVLCIWLPNWALQRLRHARPELKSGAVVLYRATRRGPCVVACSRGAARCGVTAGMPVAEASGLCQALVGEPPDLFPRSQGGKGRDLPAGRRASAVHFVRHQLRRDLEALQQLAVECQRFSPLVGLEQVARPEALLLDVTGCAHLFQGERGLADQLRRACGRWRWRIRIGLADTVGAAWAAAHFGVGRQGSLWIIPAGRQAEQLSSLPIAALRVEPQSLVLLEELGLYTIGQLQALPRASLPSRLGNRMLRQWERALGELDEPIVPWRPPPVAEARQAFEHPLRDRTALGVVLRQLLERLLEQLKPSRQGIQRLQISLQGESAASLECALGFLRPATSVSYIAEMVETRLQAEHLPDALSEVRVWAQVITPLDTYQERLFAEPEDRQSQRSWTHLMERLSARLGEQAVLSAHLRADAQPEYAFRWQPLLEDSRHVPGAAARTKRVVEESSEETFCAARPLWLRHPPHAIRVTALAGGLPLRFRWRGREYTVRRRWGPERIETGWWRSSSVRRDYYRVETDRGQRFWLFRQAGTEEADRQSWFLQGVFE